MDERRKVLYDTAGTQARYRACYGQGEVILRN